MIRTCSRITLGALTRTYLRTSAPRTSAVFAHTICECHNTDPRHQVRHVSSVSLRDRWTADVHAASVVVRSSPVHLEAALLGSCVCFTSAGAPALICLSMRGKLISNDLAALHHE